MREAFDVMGSHPYLTVLLCFTLVLCVESITEIFKRKR